MTHDTDTLSMYQWYWYINTSTTKVHVRDYAARRPLRRCDMRPSRIINNYRLSEKQSIIIHRWWNVSDDMCRKGNWSWFVVNRSTFDEKNARKTILADRTEYGRAYATVLRPSSSSSSVVVYLSVTLWFVAKRCVIQQKLLFRAYRKSYMRNRLVPKWMTLTFV